jgi:hypothetical protein
MLLAMLNKPLSSWGCQWIGLVDVGNSPGVANTPACGPPCFSQVAAFLPLQLVGALAASYVFLGESVTNTWEEAGAVLVLCTLSWYLWVQKRLAHAATAAALRAEADEGCQD